MDLNQLFNKLGAMKFNILLISISFGLVSYSSANEDGPADGFVEDDDNESSDRKLLTAVEPLRDYLGYYGEFISEKDSNWCPDTCENPTEIHESPNLKSYCTCDNNNKTVKHRCQPREIFNSTLGACSRVPGGGSASCVIKNHNCPKNRRGLMPHPDNNLFQHYVLCLEDLVVVARCDDMYYYDQGERSCRKMHIEDTLLAVSDCPIIPAIECSEPGVTPMNNGQVFESETLRCANCFYICSVRDMDMFELKISCENITIHEVPGQLRIGQARSQVAHNKTTHQEAGKTSLKGGGAFGDKPHDALIGAGLLAVKALESGYGEGTHITQQKTTTQHGTTPKTSQSMHEATFHTISHGETTENHLPHGAKGTEHSIVSDSGAVEWEKGKNTAGHATPSQSTHEATYHTISHSETTENHLPHGAKGTEHSIVSDSGATTHDGRSSISKVNVSSTFSTTAHDGHIKGPLVEITTPNPHISSSKVHETTIKLTKNDLFHTEMSGTTPIQPGDEKTKQYHKHNNNDSSLTNHVAVSVPTSRPIQNHTFINSPGTHPLAPDHVKGVAESRAISSSGTLNNEETATSSTKKSVDHVENHASTTSKHNIAGTHVTGFNDDTKMEVTTSHHMILNGQGIAESHTTKSSPIVSNREHSGVNTGSASLMTQQTGNTPMDTTVMGSTKSTQNHTPIKDDSSVNGRTTGVTNTTGKFEEYNSIHGSGLATTPKNIISRTNLSGSQINSEKNATEHTMNSLNNESRTNTDNPERTSKFTTEETKGILDVRSVIDTDNRSSGTESKISSTYIEPADRPCQSVGFFRYNYSCSMHYECYYSEKHKRIVASKLYQCPNCLQFNVKTSRCDIPDHVPECGIHDPTYQYANGYRITKPVKMCTGPGIFADPLDSSKFYECVDIFDENINYLTVSNCPAGESFNPRDKKCERDYVRPSNDNLLGDCKRNKYAFHKSSCQRFFYCIDESKSIQMKCLDGYMFNGQFCQLEVQTVYCNWDPLKKNFYKHRY